VGKLIYKRRIYTLDQNRTISGVKKPYRDRDGLKFPHTIWRQRTNGHGDWFTDGETEHPATLPGATFRSRRGELKPLLIYDSR